MKKQYSRFQRFYNIVNRAIEECGLELDENKSMQDIEDEACNLLLETIDYDRIEVAELSNHHSHLSWSDDMGYSIESDGQHIDGEIRDIAWFRRDEESGEYKPIQWHEVDTENDYMAAGTQIDSEGQVVLLVSR